jgi:hypothetical protein
MKKTVLNQKGANGIIAEYQCALQLHSALAKAGHLMCSSEKNLQTLLDAKVAQFSGELNKDQIHRAKKQGDALGNYVHKCLEHHPSALMLPAGFKASSYRHEVIPTGHITIKKDSSDLLIRMTPKKAVDSVIECPISLKAYRGSTTSQGSKGGKAALTRLFLFKDKVTAAEFAEFFGKRGKSYLEHLALFKQTAKEFYDNSDEGRAFIAAYQARKGKGAKVNNPLRRKEVGEYFMKKTGTLSEHVLARLYAEMFNDGFARLSKPSEKAAFSDGLRFVLGIEKQFVTLNAICHDDEPVRVENCAFSSDHGLAHRILSSDYSVCFNYKPDSSIVSVIFNSSTENLKLNLAIWKDGTIQFKMDSGVAS